MSSKLTAIRETLTASAKLVGGQVSVGLNSLLGSRAGDSFGILMYHRITPPSPGLPTPSRNVTPRRFQQQMEGLIAASYQVLPLGEVIACCQSRKPLPPRVVVITFDDGYRNVYLHAWPVLKRLGLPATIFLATAYLGSDKPFPFDPWGTAHRSQTPSDLWAPLRWAECLEMEASGLVEIGTHTHTHEDFRDHPEAFRQDLLVSLEVLEKRIGAQPYPFAFPYGGRRQGFSAPCLVEIAEQVGVTCALTTEIKLVSPQSSPFGWGRFEAIETDTAAVLDAKLKGRYNWMGSLREGFRRISLVSRTSNSSGKNPSERHPREP